MRRLLVLRHAQAAWPDGVDDVDRPLTDHGAQQAAELGEQLQAPDRVLVSPARRTRETWALTAVDAPVQYVNDIYEASWRRLLQIVRERGGDARTLLLVGHNPGVHDLVTELGVDLLTFPPATLATLDLPIDDWSEATERYR